MVRSPRVSPARRNVPPAVLATLALMLALVAGACGGGGSDASDEEAAALLRQTFANQQAVRSGRLDLKMNLDAKGVEGVEAPVAMRLTGPFDNGVKKGTRPKFDFDLTVRTGSASLKAGAVSDGRKGYLRLAGRAYTLDGALGRGLTEAARKGGGGPTLSGLGLDPRRWLSDVRAEGEETVAGSRTVHISGRVDVKKLVGDLDKLLDAAGGAGITGALAPDALSGSGRDALTKAVDRADVDIWAGKADKSLRRLLVALQFGGDERSGTLRVDFNVAALNQKQAIGPPANPRPLSELAAALASLASRQQQGQPGAAAEPQAQDGTTTEPRSGASTATPPASQYDACLADAKSDLAAAQRCADLLGK
jgi:hypothetical protein